MIKFFFLGIFVFLSAFSADFSKEPLTAEYDSFNLMFQKKGNVSLYYVKGKIKTRLLQMSERDYLAAKQEVDSARINNQKVFVKSSPAVFMDNTKNILEYVSKSPNKNDKGTLLKLTHDQVRIKPGFLFFSNATLEYNPFGDEWRKIKLPAHEKYEEKIELILSDIFYQIQQKKEIILNMTAFRNSFMFHYLDKKHIVVMDIVDR